MGSAKVAYGDAYGDVYNDLKHVELLGCYVCILYMVTGSRASGKRQEQDQLLGKWRGCWLTILHVGGGTPVTSCCGLGEDEPCGYGMAQGAGMGWVGCVMRLQVVVEPCPSRGQWLLSRGSSACG